MAIKRSVAVSKNSGAAFEIRRRRRLRIARKSIVDFVAFNPARFNRAVRSGSGQWSQRCEMYRFNRLFSNWAEGDSVQSDKILDY
jgi:hypothetical protein